MADLEELIQRGARQGQAAAHEQLIAALLGLAAATSQTVQCLAFMSYSSSSLCSIEPDILSLFSKHLTQLLLRLAACTHERLARWHAAHQQKGMHGFCP